MPLRSNLVKLLGMLLLIGLFMAGNAFSASESEGTQKEKAADDKNKIILSNPNKQQTNTNVQEMRKEFTAIRGKLKDIQKTALENNPELKEQKEELDKLIKKTFDENLAAQGVEVARIRDIVTQLRSDDNMSQEKKERLKKEYQEAERAYQEAQAKTLQDGKIQEMRRDFGEKMVVAMEEENPKVQDMIKELRSLQRKINQARRQSSPAPEKGLE